FMSKQALCAYYEEQMQDAFDTDLLLSVHVKATMMKVSHPIVFGHAVRTYYKDTFTKHAKLFAEIGVNPNNGMSGVYE
ncbi:NADP-dependent isocitrate dehydrogenase, partial [Salmonella enterica]|uniref:NADP-dependent isocitrate dehydrogenase n=3 Tax=Pseudomonadota TaxID=1224 RepID=UPI003CF835F1